MEIIINKITVYIKTHHSKAKKNSKLLMLNVLKKKSLMIIGENISIESQCYIILTAFGAWVGAGAAYFFGREILRESANS